MLSPQRVPGYNLHDLRHSKREGRNRRRFCDKTGHGPWLFTCGWTEIDFKVTDSDSGHICQRCGFYLKQEKFAPKLVQMTGVA